MKTLNKTKNFSKLKNKENSRREQRQSMLLLKSHTREAPRRNMMIVSLKSLLIMMKVETPIMIIEFNFIRSLT